MGKTVITAPPIPAPNPVSIAAVEICIVANITLKVIADNFLMFFIYNSSFEVFVISIILLTKTVKKYFAFLMANISEIVTFCNN